MKGNTPDDFPGMTNQIVRSESTVSTSSSIDFAEKKQFLTGKNVLIRSKCRKTDLNENLTPENDVNVKSNLIVKTKNWKIQGDYFRLPKERISNPKTLKRNSLRKLAYYWFCLNNRLKILRTYPDDVSWSS